MIILVTVIISLVDETAMEIVDFSQDIFFVDITIAKKGRVAGARERARTRGRRGEAGQTEMEGKHFSNAYLI